MKCPHCNQNHPDGFQFCPATGKKIEVMKACTRSSCPDYGKYVLPPDSRFCPTCGCELESIIGPETDWGRLFPIFGVTLGETNIHDLAKSSRIKECGAGLFYYIDHRDVSVMQRRKDSFINNMWVSASDNTTFPKKWQSMLGINFGMSIEKCKKTLKSKGLKLYDDCHSDKVVYITPDNKYIISLSFEDDIFNLIDFDLYTCPYCGSEDIEISFDDYNDVALLCQSCGREWGAVDDEVEDDDDIPNCPECGSDDVTDDGTGYMQYKCNDCGHVWGEEDDEDEDDEDDEYGSEQSSSGHYRISNKCVACGICIDECPVGAISEGRRYSIDPDECVGCGTCAGICPNEAIYEV